MAATVPHPAPAQFHDEAFAAPGEPREHYEDVLDALGEHDLDAAARDMRADMRAQGCTFGDDDEAFKIDPVPRVFPGDEWLALAAGLEQRVRALDAFVGDVYGRRRIVQEGVIPARVVDGAEYYEPELAELPTAPLHIAIAGLDIVRTPAGELQVLEDNLRTPSGLAYAFAARRAVRSLLPEAGDPVPVEEVTGTLLLRALKGAARPGHGRRVVLLTDGPENPAHWEHQQLADLLQIELVSLRDFDPSRPDVVYRRTNEDRLRDERGRLTAVGAALHEGLRAGRLVCVNGLGNGVADDKLVHAYVEDMVRFYLGEEPLVRSVPTFDVGVAGQREEVLDRLAEMVVKPRAAYGGEGVVIGPHTSPGERDAIAAEIRRAPENWIAQETVWISRHPTVIDGRLQPRHVDLRAFVTFDGEQATTIPGGLTRVAYPEGELIVNSSRGGGGKDTWVLP